METSARFNKAVLETMATRVIADPACKKKMDDWTGKCLNLGH